MLRNIIKNTSYMDSCKTIYNKVFLEDVKCTVRSRSIYSLFIINKYVYPNMPTLRCILESNIKYGESYFPIFTKEGFILKEYDGNEFFFIIYNTPLHKNKMLLDMLIEGSEREDLGFLNKSLIFSIVEENDLIEFVGNLRIYRFLLIVK